LPRPPGLVGPSFARFPRAASFRLLLGALVGAAAVLFFLLGLPAVQEGAGAVLKSAAGGGAAPSRRRDARSAIVSGLPRNWDGAV
jgi:hypothetical protein